MFNLGSIFVILGADTSGLNRGEARMTRFANKVNRQFEIIEGNAKKLNAAFIGIGAAAAIKGAVRLADEYKGINGRIAQATKATKDYMAVQERLQKMSMDVGSGFGSSTSLFQNIARAAPEVGKTNKEALRLTESLLKLSILSGATGEAMKHAMVQFGQSMAAGIVRAEEWNSIMENTPEIGVRIAKGLGMTVGQLRLAIVDGKILSKQVFESLLKQSGQIDKDFADMPRRIHQSYEALKTGAMNFLGQVDSIFGVTEGISNLLRTTGTYLGGDFRQSIFDIKNDVMAIGEGFSTWDLGIQKSLNSEPAVDFFSTMEAGLAGIWDSIIKMPINLKILIGEAGAGFAAMYFTIEAQVQQYGAEWKVIFESIKMYASLAAAFIAEKLSGSLNSVLGSMSNAMIAAGDMAATFGWDEGQKSAQDFASSIDGAKGSALKFADAMKQSAVDSKKSIGQLAVETRDIEDAWKANIKALDENRDAEVSLARDQLAAIDANKAARQSEFDDKKSKSEAERLMAEKNFQEQQALMKTLGVDPNAKGGRKGGRAGSSADPNKELQSKMDSLTKSLQTELELENQHYRESQAALDQAEALGLSSVISYHEMRERLERDHIKKLQEVNQEGLQGIYEIRQFNAIRNGQLEKQVGAMTTAEQAKTFTDLIDQAAEHNKVFFEMKKAMALATAAIDAPKAILSSFAFGSEIGGPVVGAIFGGIAAAAVGVQMGAIAGAQYQGGKATGGQVHANRGYKVNEQGPEMLSSGGQDYLMMGSKGGSITPNHKLGGGGSNTNVSVNIHNYAGVQVTTKEGGDSNNKTIEIILKKVDEHMASNINEGRGRTHKAIANSFGVSRGRKTA